MKRFNKVITIEVSVDSIAEQLLDTISPEFKHREILAEAIIGRMERDNSLSYLYNSLNGYPCDIDFKIGDEVRTENPMRIYGYWTLESIEKNDSIYNDVYTAKVVEINPYADEKLKIQFDVPGKTGQLTPQTKWVRHTDWNISVVELA